MSHNIYIKQTRQIVVSSVKTKEIIDFLSFLGGASINVQHWKPFFVYALFVLSVWGYGFKALNFFILKARDSAGFPGDFEERFLCIHRVLSEHGKRDFLTREALHLAFDGPSRIRVMRSVARRFGEPRLTQFLARALACSAAEKEMIDFDRGVGL